MELKSEHIEYAQHTTFTVHVSYSVIYCVCDSLAIAKQMLERCVKKNGEGYVVEQITTIATTVYRESVEVPDEKQSTGTTNQETSARA